MKDWFFFCTNMFMLDSRQPQKGHKSPLSVHCCPACKSLIFDNDATALEDSENVFYPKTVISFPQKKGRTRVRTGVCGNEFY